MTDLENLIARLRRTANNFTAVSTEGAVLHEAADALATALRVTEPAEAITKLCDWYVPEAMPLPVTLPLPQKRQDPNDPPSVTLDDRFFRNIAHWRQTGKERI